VTLGKPPGFLLKVMTKPMKSGSFVPRSATPGTSQSDVVRLPDGFQAPLPRSFSFFLTLISRRVSARHRSCEQMLHALPRF